MAYDANSHYEPPRRAYYNQPPAPPVQNGYGYQEQEQYDGYAQQPYDQGYDQQYGDYQGQYNGYEQEVRQPRKPQAPQYADGYGGGYHKQPRQPAPRQAANGYDQRQERQYDPRYQQRQERGRQPAYEQQSRPRPPPVEQQPVQQQSGLANRPNPRAGRTYAQESQVQPQHPPQQTTARPPQNKSRPTLAPPPGEKKPDSSSMEEWKAKEKARLQADALREETLAQDNAFPVFPTKRERSRTPAGGRSGTDSAMDNRPNGEQPQAAEVMEPSREAMPNMSRNHSDPQTSQQHLDRPPMDHKPYSFDWIQSRPPGEQASAPMSPPQQQRAPYQQPRSNATSPQQTQPQPNWPKPEQQRSPPPLEQRPPPQPSAPSQQYTGQAPRPPQDSNYSRPQPRQPAMRGPAPARIDTAQAQQQGPAYMDHQPLSPAQVPARPSTAQGRGGPKSPLGQSVMSPTSAYSTDQTPRNFSAGAVPPPNQAWGQQHAKQESLNDIYNQYQDNHVSPPAVAAPMTRAEEIEAEMPDFDSAAPGGTSLLHKRKQSVEKQRPVAANQPPVANLQQYANSSAPSLQAQKQQFYGQQQDPTSTSLPDQRGPRPRQNGGANGFDFGIPGSNGQQPYADQYGQPPPQQRGMGYDPRAPMPPYAHDQQGRRSMDDARQMPVRQRPPPKGGFGPQRGPGMDRQIPGAPPQRPGGYDPVHRNVSASAPPQQQNFPGPQGYMPNGAPPMRQRSAPGQQPNPDALPSHPVPVRPGLMDGGGPQSSKPPPLRNYDNGQSSHQRKVSVEQSSRPERPVTKAELDQLRAAVSAQPNNSRQALSLVKRLVEAADILSSEGGRADQRTTVRNREQYLNEALKRIKKLVSAGYPDAQFYFADCYGQGLLGLEVDTKEAFNLYQAAAKAGHPQAAYRTAVCCEMGPEDGGGTRKDYPKAVQWYRRAAALGDPDGMYKLGIILLKGLLGQQRNIGEALNLLKRAVERSGVENPHALHELATLYESANTNPEVRNKVVADDRYALELFQKAAKAGHKASQFRLGQAYEYGNLGVGIDNRASITWYTKAAAQGEHNAELALSGWYLTGAEGILEHSDTEAYLWARKAASSEPPLAKAMFAMGYFTEAGIGCPKNIEEAKRWYSRAASYQFPKAQERLEELKRNGGKNSKSVNGKISRKDQKRDEAECTVM